MQSPLEAPRGLSAGPRHRDRWHWLRFALLVLYVVWTAILVIGHVSDNFETLEDVTRFILLGYAGLAILWLPALRVLARRIPLGLGPKYVLFSLVSAAITEAAFLISKPFDERVKVVIGSTPPETALTYLAIDWAVTLPAYVLIFTFVWWRTLSRHRYSSTEFLFLLPIAQYLGDGHYRLLANPLLTILYAPYFLMAYQCMNLPSYLILKPQLDTLKKALDRGRYRAFWVVPVIYWLYIGLILAFAAIGQVVMGES